MEVAESEGDPPWGDLRRRWVDFPSTGDFEFRVGSRLLRYPGADWPRGAGGTDWPQPEHRESAPPPGDAPDPAGVPPVRRPVHRTETHLPEARVASSMPARIRDDTSGIATLWSGIEAWLSVLRQGDEDGHVHGMRDGANRRGHGDRVRTRRRQHGGRNGQGRRGGPAGGQGHAAGADRDRRPDQNEAGRRNRRAQARGPREPVQARQGDAGGTGRTAHNVERGW